MDNPIVAALVGLFGVALLVVVGLKRAGRHWWAREWTNADEPSITTQMALTPGIGAAMVALGAMSLGEGTLWAAVITVVCLPAGMVLIAWGGLLLRVPVWFLPKWSRARIRGRREAEQKRKRARKDAKKARKEARRRQKQ